MVSTGGNRPAVSRDWRAYRAPAMLFVVLLLSGLLVAYSRSRPGAKAPVTTVTTPEAPEGAAAALTEPAQPSGATPSSLDAALPGAAHGSEQFLPFVSAAFVSPLVVQAGIPSQVRTKIEIVWPHGGASVNEAALANVTAYVIAGAGQDAPPCSWQPVVRLWSAYDGKPARPIATGRKRMASLGGNAFPVWDFNDVDVSEARQPAGKMAFYATVDDVETAHNVWLHAADARTIFPQTDVPAGVTDRLPAAVDARIELVWPHDDASVEQANLANVTVYLFESGSNTALAPDLAPLPAVRLHRSLNSNPEDWHSALTGVPRTIVQETVRFLAWDFNDVDVSAARDPLNRIYFWVSVDGVSSFSNIWAHGVDARTIFPDPEILSSCR